MCGFENPSILSTSAIPSHLDRSQFTRDQKYFLFVKTWLPPRTSSRLGGLWLSIAFIFSHRLLITMSGFTFLTINHHPEPQSCLQNTFYAAAAGVYPSCVQGGLCVRWSPGNCWSAGLIPPQHTPPGDQIWMLNIPEKCSHILSLPGPVLHVAIWRWFCVHSARWDISVLLLLATLHCAK